MSKCTQCGLVDIHKLQCGNNLDGPLNYRFSVNVVETARCCPFLTTPGKFLGEWTNCIHGLSGRREELYKEINEINELIRGL